MSLLKQNKNKENIKLYKSQIEFYEKNKEELKKQYKEKFDGGRCITNIKKDIEEGIEAAKKKIKQYSADISVVEK